jgi:hypothetical protein
MGVAEGYIINSYRYLRLGLVVVTLTLGISLVIEIATAGCLQGSISAFYYTPVHALFIGILFVIGVALVALRGRDPVEDLFFNLAGFLAPVVALVPTSRPMDLCGPTDRLLPMLNSAFVTNNVASLFLGFGIALAAAYVMARFIRGRDTPSITELPRSVKFGLTLSTVVLIVGVVWYAAWNESFHRRAHSTAAVLMFVAIWFAVLVNADYSQLRSILRWCYRKLAVTLPEYPPQSRHFTFYRPFYQGLGVVMFVFGVVLGVAVRAGVNHAVFWLEVAEIVPFATFWALQTGEGWDTGTTITPAPTPTTSAPELSPTA